MRDVVQFQSARVPIQLGRSREARQAGEARKRCILGPLDNVDISSRAIGRHLIEQQFGTYQVNSTIVAVMLVFSIERMRYLVGFARRLVNSSFLSAPPLESVRYQLWNHNQILTLTRSCTRSPCCRRKLDTWKSQSMRKKRSTLQRALIVRPITQALWSLKIWAERGDSNGRLILSFYLCWL